MEGGDAFATIARTHRRFGTTSLLATTMTAPREEIADILSQLGDYCRRSLEGGSRILGVHLEGPYINSGKLGAQPNFAHAAVLEEVEDYLRRAPIRVITIAPEIAGHRPLIRALAERGVRLQIGHTLGSYEDGVAALEAGASSFTHLYNAMTGLHHREPGIVGAALAHARYAELIPDLLHVHPGAIRVALRSIPCLYCVTDSTAAAGMPDGQYKLGSHTVTKCLGGVRLPDGTLAGSTLTMDQALRNLVKIGLPLAEASQRLSQFPADYLGLAERGTPGARSLGRCGAPGSLPGTRRRDGGRRTRMTSLMLEEALSAAAVASRQLAVLDACLPALGQRLREVDPNLALTVARGSSDHAASYFAYLAMQHAGLPVASLPMSVVTLNRSPLRVAGQAVFAFSQSGQSPDLVDSLRILRERGALGIALVNAEDSPLEAASEFVVPLCAGSERSVAATKSFIATLSASARLLAHWQRDNALLAAGRGLAAGLEQAARLDWSPAIEALRDCQRLMVIGRGAGYAIAQEAALKFKETSAIQAEAFSSAEVRHGPMALVEERYPLLVFAPRGPEQEGLLALAEDMRQRGAQVLLAAPDDIAERDLPLQRAAHPALDPILAIQSFYVMAAGLAEARGMDPDQPRHLSKVTRTH